MKRFVDTELYDKPWFFELEPKHQRLWLLLLFKCDCIGIIKINLAMYSFYLNEPIEEKDIEIYGKRFKKISESKYIITKFCAFQYGILTARNRPHVSYIVRLVASNAMNCTKISVAKSDKYYQELEAKLIPYRYPLHRLKDKDKETDKDQDKDQDIHYTTKEIPFD